MWGILCNEKIPYKVVMCDKLKSANDLSGAGVFLQRCRTVTIFYGSGSDFHKNKFRKKFSEKVLPFYIVSCSTREVYKFQQIYCKM
jgi:hypothetical protein